MKKQLPTQHYKFRPIASKSCFAFFTILLMLVSFSGIAQRDLIVTQAGENIRCRILDETATRFIFAYVKNEKIYRSEIFKNLVTSFKYNSYDTDLKDAKYLPKAEVKESYGGRSGTTTTSEGSETAVEKTTVVKEKRKKTEEAKLAKTDEKAKKTANKTEEVKKEDAVTALPKVVQPEKSAEKTAEKVDEAIRNEAKEKTVSAPRQSVPMQKESVEAPKTTIVTQPAIETAPPVPTTKAVTPTTFNLDESMKFRVGVRAGIGNRQATIDKSTAFGLYQEQLLRGWTFGTDLAYFFKDNIGFGLVYNNFQSKNTSTRIAYFNELLNKEVTGSINDKRSIKFFGPALFLRKKLDFKTFVVLTLSPGAYFYSNKGLYEDLSYTSKGTALGGSSTLGVDFLLGNDIIGRDIILSLEAGYNVGKINSLNYGDARGNVSLANPIDISRLDFTIGLRFTRFPKYMRLSSY
jgi:hypothetical protein